MRLNKSVVDSLPLPVLVPPATHAQAFHRDDFLKGFAVRITTTGARCYLLELLTHRKREADALPERSRYVFPGEGKTGYLIEPRKQIAHVIARSGVTFTPHDLWRTFITLAESLDIPAYALKRLLNHRMTGDVTAGYMVADVERLRRPMQQIEDFILKAAGVKASADVVDIARTQRASA